jgi:hypothetical protein
MNDVVFVMVNSTLNKKKQARKGKVYDIDDLLLMMSGLRIM